MFDDRAIRNGRGSSHVNGVEPGFSECGPVCDRKLGRTQAIAMAAFRVEVQFGGNLRLLQSLKVEEGILFVDRIILCLKQKSRWRVGGRADAFGELTERGSVGEISRVDNDGKIWTCVQLVRRLARTLVVGMVAEDDSKVRSSGEAQDTDALRIDLPLGCMSARDAHRLLRVFEIGGILRIMRSEGNAVLHQNAGHADRVQPRADLGAFEVVGEDFIGTAGKDEDRSTGVLCCFGTIKSERRLADVGQMHQRLACDKAAVRFGDVPLRAPGIGLGCTIGPERQSDLLRGGEGRGSKESDRKK